jgi:hypothetical protein
MPLSTTRSLLATAIAASLLVATPALARTTDDGARAAARTSSLAGTVSPGQDLRGEHARDAARAVTITPATPRQDLRGEHARDAARTTPMPATPPADTPAQPVKALPVADSDGGLPATWLLVLAGLAGAALAAGGTVRVRAQRHA